MVSLGRKPVQSQQLVEPLCAAQVQQGLGEGRDEPLEI